MIILELIYKIYIKIKKFLQIPVRYFVKMVVAISFYTAPKKGSKPTLLIISDNGLGDYFLVQNYFKYLRTSTRYKNHKIIVLSKTDRIDCYKKFNKDIFDEIIPFYPAKYTSNFIYRIYILNKLIYKNITEVLNVLVSYTDIDYDSLSTTSILQYLKPEHAVAHIIKPNDNKLLEKFNLYDELITTDRTDMYEFDRNRQFFENLLGLKIYEGNLPRIKTDSNVVTNRIGICPFKRNTTQVLTKEFWIELINLITENNPNFAVSIIGAPQDFSDVNEIIRSIKNNNNVLNLAGKIKSSDLPEYIHSCEALISVETGTVHIASAVDTNTLCISNGSFYKRFQPIPSDYINYIYPPEYYNTPKPAKDGLNIYANKTEDFDINTITAETIFNKFNEILNNTN